LAAGDFFLKLDGIQGESQDDKHKNEIQLASFSIGVTCAGAGSAKGAAAAVRSNLQDMHFTKQTDSSSANLFLACCTARPIPTATVTIRKAGEHPVEYLVYKLTDVFVSSHNASGQQGGGIAHETFSLNFSKVEMTYTPQNADGTSGAKIIKTYDVKGAKTS
jgi:type VI secretion system secreted protein Hcp